MGHKVCALVRFTGLKTIKNISKTCMDFKNKKKIRKSLLVTPYDLNLSRDHKKCQTEQIFQFKGFCWLHSPNNLQSKFFFDSLANKNQKI